MRTNKIALKNRDTYVYIDVSNIRSACYKTLDFRLDFVKLLSYFKNKYPNLKDVRYYEGIAQNDKEKRRMFNFLERKGYTICSLERKAYNSTEIEEREVKCPGCGNKWVTKIVREHRMMKSNVDVYLASDMMVQASQAERPTRLILVSCDGDYAEAIRNMISFNPNVYVAVLATPYVKNMAKNTFSVRLRRLNNEFEPPRYVIHDITDVISLVKSDRTVRGSKQAQK